MIGRDRRVSPLEDPTFGWAEHDLEPRWLGMESSDCAAALDPSIYHGRGIDELERFLAGGASPRRTRAADHDDGQRERSPPAPAGRNR